MGNVMGNVSWMTKDFRSDGRLSIGSTGHKNLYIGIGLGGSSLDAKGGIVGGTIELSRIDTYSKFFKYLNSRTLTNLIIEFNLYFFIHC